CFSVGKWHRWLLFGVRCPHRERVRISSDVPASSRGCHERNGRSRRDRFTECARSFTTASRANAPLMPQTGRALSDQPVAGYVVRPARDSRRLSLKDTLVAVTEYRFETTKEFPQRLPLGEVLPGEE